uniref:Uncharacterized protein n=1 Tax=Anguilla anguilla TaxID=7936 RepID=A0A0E9TSK0_ANGAN
MSDLHIAHFCKRKALGYMKEQFQQSLIRG